MLNPRTSKPSRTAKDDAMMTTMMIKNHFKQGKKKKKQATRPPNHYFYEHFYVTSITISETNFNFIWGFNYFQIKLGFRPPNHSS